jgi:hypothetical protein
MRGEMINSIITAVQSDANQLKTDTLYLCEKVQGSLTPVGSSPTEVDRNKKIGLIAVRVLMTLAMGFYAYQTARLVPSLLRAPISTILTGFAFCLMAAPYQNFFDKTRIKKEFPWENI